MPAAEGASTAVGCADSGLSLDGGHQDGQNGRRRMSGRLGRLGAALHDSATVREFGSKLMRAPGLTVYMQWPGSSAAMPSYRFIVDSGTHWRHDVIKLGKTCARAPSDRA
jgi:hypothetical protein